MECEPQGGVIQTESDALDLIAACGENETSNLLIHAENLPEAFYDLRTGFAGAILLKFSNYRLRVAAILDPVKSSRGRFGEMALETNRGNQFRIFPDVESAETWLLHP
ncbi:DUF4180 domain-containing protein [Anaerolinea thermolimosa]|uniref:DUF4180 domain-containing protein n=1 Tax=Anaerolinea thermolimosa TaxID=229919 RepID=UPI0023514F71|nr:DUF4180 domain-containing protein [Anaerolinea thermolimosa]